MNPETGKGCETVRAGYDMSEDDHPTGALVEGAAPVPAIPTGPTLENLTIFGGTANPNWAAWDCCGGSTPGLVEDVDRGNVFQLKSALPQQSLGLSVAESSLVTTERQRLLMQRLWQRAEQ